ncbi:MAG: hypothetical protein JWP09_587 [Candidatus Taylorbacteria bacterium]|nr:hypothetical protein [Candidatus Taylorbacteria bacterium]
MNTTAFPLLQNHETTRRYVMESMHKMCLRLLLEATDSQRIMHLTKLTLDICIANLSHWMTQGFVTHIPHARELVQIVLDRALSSDSAIAGQEYLAEAIEVAKTGANVLVVQNHRSGADTGVFEMLIKRSFGDDTTRGWAYMSGHIVNVFLAPMVFSTSLDRYQIYSVKNQTGTGVIEQITAELKGEMVMQNMRAMTALVERTKQGGQFTVLYPEGGRGEGCLKQGEAKTSCIPKLISGRTDKPFYILPTFVSGATNLLPVRRGPNEYNQVFDSVERGQANLRIGQMICGNTFLDRCSYNDRIIADGMMLLIAALAPNVAEKGPYGTARMEELAGRLIG